MNKEFFLVRNKCPVCSSSNFRNLVDKPYTDESIISFINSYYKKRVDYELIKNNRYILSKCKNCRTIFQKQIFNSKATQLLYEEYISSLDSLNKRESSSFSYFNALIKDATKVTCLCERIFKKIPRKTNVLDFGMGWGHWLLAAKSCGLNVYGAEISKPRIEFAKKNGLDIINPFEKEYENFFHFINTDQVFEHLSEPRQIIHGLVKALKKGGIIKINVPYPTKSFLKIKLLKEKWKPSKDAFHPLEHINAFNYKALCYLAKTCDLEPMKISQVESNIYGRIKIKDKIKPKYPALVFSEKI